MHHHKRDFLLPHQQVTAGKESFLRQRRIAMKDYALNRAIFLEQSHGPGVLRRMFRNWTARRNIAKLTELDDNLLQDIGVTREDIQWAKGLPLAVNAAIALEELIFRRQRRGEVEPR